ncbi:hypothetical protein [Deinococcus budaensis]|uniref:Uncharacterized protein n=1 Tax=Deinococcus budaensis TaxID=1665626 RepID=A0A7W8GFT0_9DEIO|nr:hypothetical protein [Deinococcus budaensis]MBB5234539.1 hypothetical protein [Deinococcus budaensis]
MTGILVLGLCLGVLAFFARRQERLNRVMDAMDGTRRGPGHVGPTLPGPGGTTGL